MLTRSETGSSVVVAEHTPAAVADAGYAIEAHGLVKTYRLYRSATHQAMDILGVYRLMPWRRPDFQEFRALDGMDLKIGRGERVGVIGRNGAGKTTLLKLITGATEPTSGSVQVDGQVQALMQVGVGFHPEFSGIENIRSSLLFTGLSEAECKDAEADIIEFCELGDFLSQPIKTYSVGMQARLQFACATAIKPEILIIDEILGAGDAYFSAKSSQRMERLTKSGCTLLLVSHSMGQIMQFCNRAIWIESGRIVAAGEAREIVNQYEKFIHELRRKAKITEADQLVNANQSEWLKEKTLEALNATLKVAGEADASKDPKKEVVRWARDDSPIEITTVRIRDGDGDKASLFKIGQPIIFEIEIKALKTGDYPCRYCIVIFGSDGRLAVRHISGWFQHKMKAGERRKAQLRYDAVMLGTGDYFLSVAAYERLNLRNMNEYSWYDLHGRAYDFSIAEDPVDPVSSFHHPNRWELVAAPPDEVEQLVGPDY